MLAYWVATAALYVVCVGFLWIQVVAGEASPRAGAALATVGLLGVGCFYFLVRVAPRFGIAPWKLTIYQSLFAIACDAVAYAIIGSIRGASMMVPLVVMVFCAFSLRRRQNYLLCLYTLATMGGAMLWLARSDPLRYPPYVEAQHFVLFSISLVAVALLTGELSRLRAHLRRQKLELQSALKTIHTLATVDELTALSNRRHMHEMLSAEERRQQSHGQPICMALLDIDLFKHINDQFGHAVGDAALRHFADVASAGLRDSDALARWGGEEFLLLLPNTELDEAQIVVGRMAERVAASCVDALHAQLRLTFSGGLVARQAQEPFADAIKRADAAMYEAKKSGRNRIVVA